MIETPLTIELLADIIENIAVTYNFQKPDREVSRYISEHTLPYFIPLPGEPIYTPPRVYEVSGGRVLDAAS